MKSILKAMLFGSISAMAFAAETGEGAADAKPAKEPKVKQPEQNGVTRPAPGTKTANVWDIADQISAANGRAALREEVMTAATEAGLNKGTIATQYARWTVFHNVSADDRSAARAAAKAAAAPAAPEAE